MLGFLSSELPLLQDLKPSNIVLNEQVEVKVRLYIGENYPINMNTMFLYSILHRYN